MWPTQASPRVDRPVIPDLLDSNLATGLVGVAGVLIGLFADRLLQRQGKVRCEMEPIEMHVIAGEDPISPLRRLPIPSDLLPEPAAAGTGFYSADSGVRCFLSVKLFNEKEVKTGLRDVVLAFDASPPLEKVMKDRSTWRTETISGVNLGSRVDELEVVNLPSREWVTLSLMVRILPNEARMLTTCERAWLRGYFPDGSRFSARVPFAE